MGIKIEEPFMKKTIKCILISMTLLLPIALFSDTPSPLESRTVTINFQGQMVDFMDRPYDGAVTVEALFYNSPMRQPTDLIYAEEFTNVDVDHGIFRIPLLSGTPLEGTSPSIDLLTAQIQLYADIKVNGAAFLEAWPVGSQFAAIRAEHAVSADTLRQPLSLSAGDIPQHRAGLISSGVLNITRLPSIPGTRVADDPATPQNDTFPVSMVPPFDASKVTTGSFDTSAFQSGISAEWFTTGTLSELLVSYEAMQKRDVGIRMGEASNGTAVQIPSGFNRTQCTWMVSLKHFNEDVGGEAGIDHLQVLADSNGVVSCVFDTDTGGGPPTRPCTANYLTICKK